MCVREGLRGTILGGIANLKGVLSLFPESLDILTKGIRRTEPKTVPKAVPRTNKNGGSENGEKDGASSYFLSPQKQTFKKVRNLLNSCKPKPMIRTNMTSVGPMGVHGHPRASVVTRGCALASMGTRGHL